MLGYMKKKGQNKSNGLDFDKPRDCGDQTFKHGTVMDYVL